MFWGYPLPPHDYPYHWVILDPKSKEDKVKVKNLKNWPKFQIYKFRNNHYTPHTSWSCLIKCANIKWIQWVLLKIVRGQDSVHRWTDWQMNKVKPVYPPFNFIEAGGGGGGGGITIAWAFCELLGSLLLTWFNFNHNMDKYDYMPGKVGGEITYPFLNFNSCTVEV